MTDSRTGDAQGDGATPLIDRFPALLELGSKKGMKRVPFVQQFEQADCGPACLTMVLRYYGKSVSLDQVSEVVGPSRDGTSILALARAAQWFGLHARGVSADLDAIKYLELPSILHWEFSHFLVLEKVRKNGIDVVDPGMGRRHISTEEFRRSFTGVALTFENTQQSPEVSPEPNRVLHYARKILSHSGMLPHILFFSVVIQFIGLTLPILTGLIVDRVLPRADYRLLLVLSSGFLCLAVFNFLTSIIRAHLLLHLRTQLDARMTLNFLEHLMNLPYAYFQRRSSGDLLMRMNSNGTVLDIISSGAISGALDGTLVVVYLIALLIMSPLIGGLTLLLGLLRIGVFLGTRRRTRELQTENLITQSKSYGYQIQMVSGIATLKTSGSESRAVDRWSNLFVDVLNVNLERGRLSAFVEAVLGVIGFASPVIIIIVGALLVIDGHLSLGTMLALTALSAGFLGPLSALVNTGFRLQELTSFIERIDDVMQAPPEQDSSKTVRAPKLRGEVSLENVTFRYSPTSPPAVVDVSLTVQPGQFLAIVGPSAAGKSTLASLVAGLYFPTSGRVLYDGLDQAGLDLKSVRVQLGVVTQEPHLFGTSIRENISLSNPDLPLDAIIEAAELAHIHDEIMAMPMGYDTVLVDGGHSLSGGQRQRIVLARALVARPAILLLDEATSSLDAVTEMKIQKSLQGIDCTRIVIAHRLSTIANADRIVVMNQGHIMEQGNHDELMARGTLYKNLLSFQIVGPRQPSTNF